MLFNFSFKVSWYIYIPIWLDLLFRKFGFKHDPFFDLHSNMVRFIMVFQTAPNQNQKEFTFQYG